MIPVLSAFAAYLLCTLISARIEIRLELDWAIEKQRDYRWKAPIVLADDARLECAFKGLARGFLWPLWLATWAVKLFARFLLPKHSPLERIELEKRALAEREAKLQEAEELLASYRALPENQ